MASPLWGILAICALLTPACADTSGSAGGYYTPTASAPYPPANAPYPPASAPYSQHNTETSPDMPLSGYGSTGYGRAPFYPPIALSAVSAKYAVLKAHLYTLVEPVIIGFAGILVFLAVKNILIPYLSFFARTVEEEERSLRNDDVATMAILKAVSGENCLERIACQLGKKAKDYTLSRAVVRAIDDSAGEPRRLAVIFRTAAEDQLSCDSYVCKLKPSLKPVKKRKHRTTNHIL